MGAARAASLAGADDHAASLARRATPLVETPALRAEVARVLGLAEIHRGRPRDVAAALVEAAREVLAAEPAQALELLQFAIVAALHAGDWPSILAA